MENDLKDLIQDVSLIMCIFGVFIITYILSAFLY